MEALAARTHRSEDTAYTAGLLHAVGMILISEEVELEKPNRPILGNPFEPGLEEREREWLGCDHAEVGAELLARWQFPTAMVEAIRFQFAPTRSPHVPKLACLLGLARWIRDRLCSGTGTAARETADPFLLKLAELDPEGLNELVALVRERLGEAERIALG